MGAMDARHMSHDTASCSFRCQPALRKQHLTCRKVHRRSHSCRTRQKILQVCAGIENIWGVLAFSALPFATVQALADSNLGKKLRNDLEEKKPQYKAQEREKQAAMAKARQKSPWYGRENSKWWALYDTATRTSDWRGTSPWYGAERPKWLGPVEYSYKTYQTGDAPGDYAYDILQLGKDQKEFDRYFELEILHSRWAMLGALGALVPEVLQYTGLSNFGEARWWEVGKAKADGEDLNYFGIEGLRIAGGQGIIIIAICQVLLMFGPEYARACGIEALEPLGIYLPGDKNYPGGVFDPLGLSDDPEGFVDLQVKEQKNGRLAMVAWLGFFAQAAVTQKGPVENLLDFLQDPGKNNILAYPK